jgi:hypothetical protein
MFHKVRGEVGFVDGVFPYRATPAWRLEHITLEMPPEIVGRKWLKTFPPRLEGRCPFQPYNEESASQPRNALENGRLDAAFDDSRRER